MSKKARRYIPNPKNKGRITDNDILILEFLADYRFLTAEHLSLFTSRNPQSIKRRLRFLMDNLYIKRTRHPENTVTQAGDLPDIHSLLLLGAKTVAHKRHLSVNKIRYDTIDSATGELHILHTLMQNDIMSRLYAQFTADPTTTFISSKDILSKCPEKTQKSRRPFQWQVVIDGQPLGIEPDNVFAVDVKGRGAGRERIWFFVEADRGQESVNPRSILKASPKKKVICYSSTLDQGLHKELFNMKGFIVLFVTTKGHKPKSYKSSETGQRKEGIIEMVKEVRSTKGLKGVNAMMFTTLEEFKEAEDLFAIPWSRANGEASLYEMLA